MAKRRKKKKERKKIEESIEDKEKEFNKREEIFTKIIMVQDTNYFFKNEKQLSIYSNLNKRINRIEIRKKGINEKEYTNYINNRIQFKRNIIIIKLIMLNLFQILLCSEWCTIISELSTITLKIKGTGYKQVLGYENSKTKFDRQYYPNEILINNISQNTFNYSYYFNLTDNYIELIWSNNINNCSNMFFKCSDIIEFDFSNFDTSKVINMEAMFAFCSSLISLNLSNFDTSQVINMEGMFAHCSSLISLNLSNFNTTKVTNMGWMFYNCSSLILLNLSNFDTSQVTDMEGMFSHCSSLISLNLSNFNIS